MKIVYLVILSMFVFVSNGLAQSISGKVTDNKNIPVPYASIVILQVIDSTIISYTNTDDNGYYKINTSKSGNYLIRVNYLGYLTQIKDVSLSDKVMQNANFILEKSVVSLQGITVKGRYTGISHGKDTIRYNPKAFTDGSEVVLGDVLNKLPGIEVDSKGNIKAQGKQVDKLMLNGRDFFAGNTQMATKNLSADIAESVEVLNNYSEYSQLGGFQSHEQTVINVGVNKNKLGKISGNLSAGGGIEEKHNLRGNLMRLGSKSMITLLGAQNNTGEEVFSMDDYFRLQGGINEVLGNNGKFELTEDEQRLLMPQNNTYSLINGFSALNFSYQPKSQFKLNSYALFNHNETKAEDLNNYTYNLPDGNHYTTQEKLNNNTKSKLFSGYLKIDYHPNPSLSLVYKGSASNSDINKNDNIFNQMGDQQLFAFGQRNANLFRTQHGAMLMKAIGKHLFLLNAKFNYNNSPADFILKTDSLLLPLSLTASNEWYYGLQKTTQKQISGEVSAAFLYRINSNYFLRSTFGTEINTQTYTSRILENIPKQELITFGDSLQNNISSKMYDYYGGIDFIKNKGLVRFKLGASAHIYTFGGNIMNRINENTKLELNPSAEFSLIFSQRHRLNTSFSRLVSTNPVNAFLNGMVFDSYQSYTQNSSLNYLYNTQYRANVSYNLFDMFSNTMIILTGNYSKSDHTSTYNFQQKGVLSISNPITSPPAENLFASLYLNKGLGFIPWTANITGNYISNKYYNFLSETENTIKTEKTVGQLKLQSKYKFPLNFEWATKIELMKNAPSLGNTVKQTVQRYDGKLKWNVNKDLYTETEFEYVVNNLPTHIQNLYVLNACVRYKFFNNKMEVQLKGTNMLNLHKQDWTTISYNGNYMLERYFRQIPGNIMLNMNYRF